MQLAGSGAGPPTRRGSARALRRARVRVSARLVLPLELGPPGAELPVRARGRRDVVHDVDVDVVEHHLRPRALAASVRGSARRARDAGHPAVAAPARALQGGRVEPGLRGVPIKARCQIQWLSRLPARLPGCPTAPRHAPGSGHPLQARGRNRWDAANLAQRAAQPGASPAQQCTEPDERLSAGKPGKHFSAIERARGRGRATLRSDAPVASYTTLPKMAPVSVDDTLMLALRARSPPPACARAQRYVG